MAARLCRAGSDMRAEIDAAYPNRDRRSDGWIGDAAHANSTSDHNPNSLGIVRALDVDKDGIPNFNAMVERVRAQGKAGDRRLVGGYIIWNARIAGTHTDWAWKAYTGRNLHTIHAHFSFADAQSGYDALGDWKVEPVVTHSHTLPLVGAGTTGSAWAIKDLQGHLNHWRKARGLSTQAPTGVWNSWTYWALRGLQKHYGLTVDGVCGPNSWRIVHRATSGRVA